MAELDPFAVLGIARSADEAIVRAAFRLRALQAHPDRAGAGSTAYMQAVTSAYALLVDRPARARWEAGHPVHVSVGRDVSPSARDQAPSIRANKSETGMNPGGLMANRTWQWVTAVAVVIAVLVADAAFGSTAMTLAALALALAWLAEQAPDRARFWPAYDVATLMRAVVRGCAAAIMSVIVAILRR